MSPSSDILALTLPASTSMSSAFTRLGNDSKTAIAPNNIIVLRIITTNLLYIGIERVAGVRALSLILIKRAMVGFRYPQILHQY